MWEFLIKSLAECVKSSMCVMCWPCCLGSGRRFTLLKKSAEETFGKAGKNGGGMIAGHGSLLLTITIPLHVEGMNNKWPGFLKASVLIVAVTRLLNFGYAFHVLSSSKILGNLMNKSRY